MELLNYILPREVVSKVRLYHSHPLADIIKSRLNQHKQSLPWDSFLYDDEPFYKWHCDQFYIEPYCVAGKWKKCLCNKNVWYK